MEEKVYLLDSSSIIKRPEILFIHKQDIKLVVLNDIKKEIQANSGHLSGSENLFSLLTESEKNKYISVITPALFSGDYKSGRSKHILEYVDFVLVTTALRMKVDGLNVHVVSEDYAVKEFCENNSLRHLNADIFLESYKESQGTIKEEIKNKIYFVEKKTKWKQLRDVFLGGLLALAAQLVFIYFENIVNTINLWGIFCACIILGILLFALRLKQRLTYGILEFLFGIVTLINSIFYGHEDTGFSFFIKLFGGIYIMVRGQDNIMVGLEGKKASVILKNFFRI